LKVLTYNLFWWNLFGRRGGGRAGQKIADGGRHEAYDIMAFQECDDRWRVLHDAGLSSSYTAIKGGHATAIAYKTSRWELLAKGKEDVAEDQPGLYGRRGAAWVRLRRKSGGQVVFLVNHHGPLHVNTGGSCGGEATAYNMLRIVGRNAHRGDFVIVTGDFNAAAHSAAAQTLERYLQRTFTGTSFGGVDHFFAGCPAVSKQNLGSGGSDHDALEAVFHL
jgi:endonuclease/exonuclease/phosphatase family metal-dependent hydrolase